VRYDLWDVGNGGYLGRYGTEEEALAGVRVLVREYGPPYADDLNSDAEDDAGRFVEPLSGAALLSRIEVLAGS
jgi:hypothetical protein